MEVGNIKSFRYALVRKLFEGFQHFYVAAGALFEATRQVQLHFSKKILKDSGHFL